MGSTSPSIRRARRGIELLLFDNITDRQPSQVIPLDPKVNKTGDIWHIFVEGLPNRSLYNYRADGPYDPCKDGTRFNPNKTLLDPYAPAISGDFDWLAGDALGYENAKEDDPDRHLRPSKVQNTGGAARCIAYKSDFDWQGDRHPEIPIEESIIYEVNVRGFTRHHSSESDFGGTYRGFIEKIPYLKDLGITAVELLPVFEFDQFDGPFRDPYTGERLSNAWGYNTVAFFAPESHYSYYGKLGSQIDEFKFMVRELHRAGIEVILDVVFNHSREGNHFGPTISFRGLDNNVYYLLAPGQPQFYNDWTGCGNTLNCNHPVVRRFILDCLRYWVEEMHVDGFRFDLAAVFAVDVNGQDQAKTPIIEEIEIGPGFGAHQADRRAVVDPPVQARLVLGQPLGRVERQVSRHGPQVDQGRPRGGRPGHAGRRLLRPVRPRRRLGALALSTRSISSPATTGSR